MDSSRILNRATPPWVALLLVFAVSTPGCSGPGRADMVLTNGYVYTVDEEGTTAEAVAILDRKIVFVGSDEKARDFVGASTEVIDLGGRILLPGFIDSHFHPGSGAGRIFNLQLGGLDPTREAYQAAVKEFADSRPDASVIWGRGWSEAVFAGIGPRREWLDEVVPDRPVILRSDGGHSRWVNTKALEIAGITRDTPDPAGGVIEHDPISGEPSGTLREAGGLINNVYPGGFTIDQYLEGFRWLQENITGPLGITGLFSAGGSVGGNSYAAVERLAQNGELTFWLRGAYTARPSYDMEEWLAGASEGRSDHTTRHFRITAIKFYEDGVIEGHTAWLLEPYTDSKQHSDKEDFRGLQLWRPDALNAAVAAAHGAKFQTHHHAIADGSVVEALDAIAHARSADGSSRFPDSRDGITHLTLLEGVDLERFARLGVVAVPQPQWFLKDDYYYNVFVPFIGQERADRSYPMKAFFDTGTVVASSSDWGVTDPPNPLHGIQTAVMRLFPSSPFGGRVPTEVLWPEERITVDQAIRSYTINGAYSNFLENTRGSIEVGKYADLIVLDRNIIEIDPSGIGDARVLLTLFEGAEVFRHPTF